MRQRVPVCGNERGARWPMLHRMLVYLHCRHTLKQQLTAPQRVMWYCFRACLAVTASSCWLLCWYPTGRVTILATWTKRMCCCHCVSALGYDCPFYMQGNAEEWIAWTRVVCGPLDAFCRDSYAPHLESPPERFLSFVACPSEDVSSCYAPDFPQAGT